MRTYHPYEVHRVKEPLLMALLWHFIPPIAVYFKFDMLNKHLLETHGEKSEIPDGKGTLKILLALPVGILALAFAGIIFFPFFFIIPLFVIYWLYYLVLMQYRWQEELNAHIYHHNGSFN
jgi:hypothetical protein